MSKFDGEGIYRRVSVRMHADERVRALSKPQPCGLVLWWECIAGEQTTNIPGLFRIGESGWAEQLGWPLNGFRKAWKEIEAQGLARADWKARLVWIPKALKHNMPASPNVVLHWRTTWDLLPECSLKEEAYLSLKASLESFSEAYGKAFDKMCRKDTGKPSPNQEAGSRKQGSGSCSGGTGDRVNGRSRDQQPPLEALGSVFPKELALQLVSRVSATLRTWQEFAADATRWGPRRREVALRVFLSRGCPEEGKGPAYLLKLIGEGAGNPGPEPDPFDPRPSWERAGYSSLDEFEAAADERAKEVMDHVRA